MSKVELSRERVCSGQGIFTDVRYIAVKHETDIGIDEGKSRQAMLGIDMYSHCVLPTMDFA